MLLDLTHKLNKDIPTWDHHCGFSVDQIQQRDHAQQYSFQVDSYHLLGSAGTHIDAPFHMNKAGRMIHELELSELICPCYCIHVEGVDDDFQLSVKDIKSIEASHGAIKAGSIVVVSTGWYKRWDTPDKYRNNLKHPSVSQEAAMYLVDKQISALAVDTLSPDCAENGYPVHEALLPRDCLIIENLTNTETLPTIGATIIALPLKIVNGTESPARIIATDQYLWDNK